MTVGKAISLFLIKDIPESTKLNVKQKAAVGRKWLETHGAILQKAQSAKT